MLLALVETSKDIWDILQLLVLPIVLVTIPLVLKSFRDQKKSSDEVTTAAETVRSSGESFIAVLSTLESAFLHIGEIASDVKKLKQGLAELRSAFIDHIESDAAFMSETTMSHTDILTQLKLNSERMKEIDKSFSDTLPGYTTIPVVEVPSVASISVTKESKRP
jgi:predicted transcriptional regulator